MPHWCHGRVSCPWPTRPVDMGCEKKRSLGRDYHPLCLKCQQCQRQLTPGQHAEHDEKPYCTNCYMKTCSVPEISRLKASVHQLYLEDLWLKREEEESHYGVDAVEMSLLLESVEEDLVSVMVDILFM
ncbi:hypothetical protein J4Q44_G00036700 [Coregonus suidteri]|uniref:LIM zinc-binding domain-containing protein n=1 Tax=Coregonus suidteri TaxID=861788 RepID=A0AAN8M433_9TELE